MKDAAMDCPQAMEDDWQLCCLEGKACLLLAPVRADQGIWDSAKKTV